MLRLCDGRERIVLPDDGYYNTRALAARLRPHGAGAVAVDQLDLATVEAALGAGPLLSFEIHGTAAEADAVVAASELIVPSTSFGGVESMWERRARWPAETAPPP